MTNAHVLPAARHQHILLSVCLLNLAAMQYAPQLMMWPQPPQPDPWLGPRVALPAPGPPPPSMNAIEGERAELEILASRLAARIEELSASLAVLDVLDERLTSAQATERASGAVSSDQLSAKAAFSTLISLARDYEAANKAATELRTLASTQREKIAELTTAVGRLTTDVTDRSAGERPREEVRNGSVLEAAEDSFAPFTRSDLCIFLTVLQAARKAAETIALLRSELASAEAAKTEAASAKEKMRREADAARDVRLLAALRLAPAFFFFFLCRVCASIPSFQSSFRIHSLQFITGSTRGAQRSGSGTQSTASSRDASGQRTRRGGGGECHSCRERARRGLGQTPPANGPQRCGARGRELAHGARQHQGRAQASAHRCRVGGTKSACQALIGDIGAAATSHA